MILQVRRCHSVSGGAERGQRFQKTERKRTFLYTNMIVSRHGQ